MRAALSSITLMLLVALPLPAHASFYYICTMKAKVEHFAFTPPDGISATLTLLDAKLEKGHIEDKDCNMQPGQALTISTKPDAAELEPYVKQSRTLERHFDAGEYSAADIQPGDVLTLRYHFNNQRMGDRHEWQLLRVNSWLDALRY